MLRAVVLVCWHMSFTMYETVTLFLSWAKQGHYQDLSAQTFYWTVFRMDALVERRAGLFSSSQMAHVFMIRFSNALVRHEERSVRYGITRLHESRFCVCYLCLVMNTFQYLTNNCTPYAVITLKDGERFQTGLFCEQRTNVWARVRYKWMHINQMSAYEIQSLQQKYEQNWFEFTVGWEMYGYLWRVRQLCCWYTEVRWREK